jgi:iron complex transport system substrate-binding protein
MIDAGIQFISTYQNLKDGEDAEISIEALPKWDADFLFIFKSYKRHSEDLMKVLGQPIWSTLKAVQNNRVYKVDRDVWV